MKRKASGSQDEATTRELRDQPEVCRRVSAGGIGG
jgi:hypothetical protein